MVEMFAGAGTAKLMTFWMGAHDLHHFPGHNGDKNIFHLAFNRSAVAELRSATDVTYVNICTIYSLALSAMALATKLRSPIKTDQEVIEYAAKEYAVPALEDIDIALGVVPPPTQSLRLGRLRRSAERKVAVITHRTLIVFLQSAKSVEDSLNPLDASNTPDEAREWHVHGARSGARAGQPRTERPVRSLSARPLEADDRRGRRR